MFRAGVTWCCGYQDEELAHSNPACGILVYRSTRNCLLNLTMGLKEELYRRDPTCGVGESLVLGTEKMVSRKEGGRRRRRAVRAQVDG